MGTDSQGSVGKVGGGSRLERVAAAWALVTRDDPPEVRERYAADMLALHLAAERRVSRG